MEFKLDVLDFSTGMPVKLGEKIFRPVDNPLNKWIDRPKGTTTRPPMTSALGIKKSDAHARCDKLSEDAFGYIESTANDVQHSVQFGAFLSGPVSTGHGWSITPDNFHKSMICFAARKLVKHTWLNNRDEFSVPDETHADYNRFIHDAVIYALFHRSNQSSSLGNVEYKGETYDIENRFFWVSPEIMLKYPDITTKLAAQCQQIIRAKVGLCDMDQNGYWRVPAVWMLLNNPQFREQCSSTSIIVLDLAGVLISLSLKSRKNADPKFQLHRWDSGWYQIRNGLYGETTFEQSEKMQNAFSEFKIAYKILEEQLRPQIYTLGFLAPEMVLER